MLSLTHGSSQRTQLQRLGLAPSLSFSLILCMNFCGSRLAIAPEVVQPLKLMFTLSRFFHVSSPLPSLHSFSLVPHESDFPNSVRTAESLHHCNLKLHVYLAAEQNDITAVTCTKVCTNSVTARIKRIKNTTWFLSSSQFLYSCSPCSWNVTMTKPTKMFIMKKAMMMM